MLSGPASVFLFLIVLFSPTQFGKHFWPNFSLVSGLRVDYLSPTLYLLDILIIGLFISFIFKQKRIKIWLPTSVFAFVIFVSLGIFLSKSPLSGLYQAVKIAELSFLGFYVARFVKNINQILIPLLTSFVFESALTLWQFLNGGSIGGVFYFFGERAFNAQTPGIANASVNGELILRPYATFSHPNVLAGFLVLSMTFAFFCIKKPLFRILLISLGTLALFLTLSRVAILIWLVCLLLSLVRKFWKLAVLTFLLVILVLVSSPLYGRFQNISLSDEAVVNRIVLVDISSKMFFSRPILGVGLNNFLVSLPYFEKQSTSIFYIQPVHNGFLLILSELGLVGFVFVAYFLFKTMKNVMNRKKYLCLTLLLEILAISMLDHYFVTLIQGQIMLAIILGISWSDTISR